MEETALKKTSDELWIGKAGANQLMVRSRLCILYCCGNILSSLTIPSMKNDLKHSCLFQRLRDKEEDQGVHRPLDQVLDGAGWQNC